MVFGPGRGRGMGRSAGYGMGRGMAGGRGFGFRGSSPPWPYVGMGRGGLPRCGYFVGGYGNVAQAWPYRGVGAGFDAGQPSYPYAAGASQSFGTDPYRAHMTREEELDYLKDQAQAIGEQLEHIEKRIKEIEEEKQN
jgi:hypothetical protein